MEPTNHYSQETGDHKQADQSQTYDALPPVSRVATSGQRNEIIHIGDTRVYRDELMAAFGGYLNPGLRHAPTRRLANVSCLGLFAFGCTALTLGLLLVKTGGVMAPNIAIGPCLFYGGIIQILVGFFEIFTENTFGMVAFSSYGAFWLSYAAILMDDTFGIITAYNTLDPSGKMFNHALGVALIGWLFLTTLLLICTIRSTVGLFSVFLSLEAAFVVLIAGYFTESANCIKAGGALTCIVGILGFYNGFAGLATKENSWIVVTPIYMPGAHRLPAPGQEGSH
jgi:succinate-acetate transporter protein